MTAIIDESTRRAKKRIALLDPAFSALPIYEYLATLDAELWVVGAREDDAVAKIAGSRWLKQDYSQIGPVGEWLRAHECGHVVPGCTDVSIIAASSLHISTALDPLGTTTVFADKRRFRSLCRELGVPTPEGVALGDFPREGTFICKPADAYSGRGISIFDGMDGAALAGAELTAASASPTGSAIVEEFITGQLYSFSVFIEACRAKRSFFVKEGSSVNPFAVDTSYVVFDMPAKVTSDLSGYANRIGERLGLRDGLLHIQFIMRDGEPFIIEATRRCPGDLYALLIEYATGFPYAAKYASYFVDEHVSGDVSRECHVVRHTVMASRPACAGLRLDRALNLRAFFPAQRASDVPPPGQRSRIGVLFCEASTSLQRDSYYAGFMDRAVYRES